MKLLDEEGVAFTRVNYYKTPFTPDSLRVLLDKAGLGPRDVLRKRAKEYASLGLADPAVTDEQLLVAIVEHPDLLERPIAERGSRAVLARPVETVRELL